MGHTQVRTRTQVGIVGAGPAGLLLSHLLARRGIDSVLVEDRSRAYCEARQRAGVLEAGSVALLREAGLAGRLDREGLEHGGIYLQFAGERHHIDFRELTGRTVTVYAQTEVVKDLIEARLAAGGHLEFDVTGTEVADLETTRPVLRYTSADGTRHEVTCDAIAGCDGFHGICRPSVPAGLLTVWEREYPYAWLGILADVPPSTDELIYAHHPDGFALHSLRSPLVSRLYLQVSPDEQISAWPDERIWAELQRRFSRARLGAQGRADPGQGHHPDAQLRQRADAPRAAVPGRGRRAYRAAHRGQGTQPGPGGRCGAGRCLEALLRGDPRLADSYSGACLDRVWRRTHFSWWMTTMLHTVPGADPMDAQLQLAQLRYVTTSRAAATSLAENYTGYPPQP